MVPLSKLKYFLALGIWLSANIGFSHDVAVHKAITTKAAEAAYGNSPAFEGFVNVVSSDGRVLSDAEGSMVSGSEREDDPPGNQPPNPNDGGGYRSLNHFYDPLYSAYGRGLSDVPPDRRDVAGTNSFAWASISNCAAFNYSGFLGFIGRNENKTNKWSWQNARGYEWLGLTATNQIQRQTNLDNMFRAVGQVMHLLEDTSQPQHVRNEQHVDKLGKIAWESPIEDWGNDNVTNLNYGDGSMLDWRDAGFTKLEDFWDRGFYKANGDQALIDDATGTDPTKTLGLAEWCNGNFLGARHLYPEYYQPGDIRYYPYPSRNHSTDYIQKRANLASGIQPLILKTGPQGQAIYLNKTGDGVTFPDHSRFDYFGAKFPHFGMITINDNNVLSNYHNVFIPKAVEYSAGLLDYFFRGTMSVSLGYDGGSDVYTFTNKNTSGQDFYNGSFSLFEEDTNGTRTLAQQYSLIGILSDGSSTNITLSGPVTSGTKFIVIYQGTIGQTNNSALDPVDAGIGIAVAGSETVWHSSFEGGCECNYTTGAYLPEGWHIDSGDVDLEENWQPYEGDWSLDLDGFNPGTISTNIPTTSGQIYTLTIVDGNLNNTFSQMQWKPKSYTFTATNSSTLLTFHSLDSGPEDKTAYGITLDAITLTKQLKAP
jgi:hypothetical protein